MALFKFGFALSWLFAQNQCFVVKYRRGSLLFQVRLLVKGPPKKMARAPFTVAREGLVQTKKTRAAGIWGGRPNCDLYVTRAESSHDRGGCSRRESS